MCDQQEGSASIAECVDCCAGHLLQVGGVVGPVYGIHAERVIYEL
jgi:hypothetical protein